ncbi:Carboxylesterase 4A, partial [Durusdinium trenchii]
TCQLKMQKEKNMKNMVKILIGFQGDPGKVTLWGLSSGAQYVCNLLVSPAAEDLFHRAVVQSCTDLNNVRQVHGSCKVNAVKPMSSMEALMGGHFHRVPVLLGVTEHDGLGKCELEQTFLHDVRSRADFKELLQEEFGDKAEEVFSHYWSSLPDLSEAHAVHKSLSLLSNDLWYFAGTYCMAEMTALHGRNDV